MPEIDVGVKQHWIVASFVPLPDDEAVGNIGEFGEAATTVDTLLVHGTLEEAMTVAQTLAAGAPTIYFVVYEAIWWSHTSITPVQLRRVSAAIT